MRLIGHSDSGRPRRRHPGHGRRMASPISAISSARVSRSSTCATRATRNRPDMCAAPANTWNVHLQIADGLLLVIHGKDVFADARLCRRGQLLQGRSRHRARHGRAEAARNWDAGLARLRYRLQTGRAAPYRLHAGFGRHPPHLVDRRQMGLCLGSARRLHRLHLHDGRHVRPDQSPRGRPLCAAGHASGRRRKADMAGQRQVRPAPCDRQRRHRLGRLARRRPRGHGCRRTAPSRR